MRTSADAGDKNSQGLERLRSTPAFAFRRPAGGRGSWTYATGHLETK